MIRNRKDVATGSVFTLLAVVWCSYVWMTIPPGAGDGDIGPRAFPLLLGAVLGLLSAGFAVLRAFRGPKSIEPPLDDDAGSGGNELATMLTLFCLIMLYGYAMQKIGFVLATALCVALTMTILAGDRAPVRIGAMTLGVTLGCWLVFAKIMALPLAVGTWISLG
ncbi:tripartite tricarboxylate transporter TctB family protein [Pararhizobium mangrovi]|uniref:Tripartite tricarboxylate transporter TctB family protein n=1 Tax=Pararhizobium mangrovi TaxID=2590452 RepID=A0A506UI17_9HYPH|nr:tripartite tricarboxylate transporter TctB family protein [Pararhizobium mangrovi]TPW32938.1 tripartite tricarboxylate transporter TctB family protein [Pararhizobium mangrovi]